MLLHSVVSFVDTKLSDTKVEKLSLWNYSLKTLNNDFIVNKLL